MEVPPEVLDELGQLEESVESMGAFLQPFLEATPRDVQDAMPPLEAARAHHTLARAAVLLARLRLQLRGEALEEGHALRKEMDRLERYDRKLRRAAHEDELAHTRPGSELNVAAANRFISAAIPDLTPQQRALLRAQNEAGRAADCGGGGGGGGAGAGGGGGRGGGGGGVAAGAARARGGGGGGKRGPDEPVGSSGGGGKRAAAGGGKDADLEEVLAAAVEGDPE